MKFYIHLPQDFRKGHREVEIHKNGQVFLLTEEELDKLHSAMQDAPLDKEAEQEEKDGEFYREDWEEQNDTSMAEDYNDNLIEQFNSPSPF